MPKLKKFCKITRYIEQIDGELSQMIADLCLDRLFIPRGVNGITFLYPKEPSYRKEIIASAYSDNPEKAIQMLESLIVLDYLPRPGDFVLKKDDIPNSLRQKIEITSADASSVKLACGAILKPDPGFAPISTRENMAVYYLTGTQIPLNGSKATMKYASKRRGTKTKGGYHGGDCGYSKNGGIEVINIHKSIIKRALAENGFAPLISASVSWLSFLMSKPEYETLAYDQWHDGFISRDLVATYYTALMGPAIRGENLVQFSNWAAMAKSTGYKPVTMSKDVMTEGQNLINKIINGAQKHNPTCPHGTDMEREQLQQELYNVPTIQKKAGVMQNMYNKFYEGLEPSGILARMWSDETGYIIDLLVTQAFEDDDKKSTIQEIDDMIQINWKSPSINHFYIMNKDIYKGTTHPATLLSGVEKMSNTDRFLGGPRSGDGKGDPDPNLFLSVTGGDDGSNLLSIQKMFGGLMGEGQPSHLNIDAIRAMMGGFS
jgi:hypothetical protein